MVCYINKIIIVILTLLPGQMESHLYVMWMGSALWRTPTNTTMIVPRFWETWSFANLHQHCTYHGQCRFSWMTRRLSPQHLERCEHLSCSSVEPSSLYEQNISGIVSQQLLLACQVSLSYTVHLLLLHDYIEPFCVVLNNWEHQKTFLQLSTNFAS
jgi:hypothetical protein